MSDDYNIGAIHRLLVAVFESGEALLRFCRFHDELAPVVASFGPGMGVDDMADNVIDYCRTRLKWEDLLSALRDDEDRGAAYAMFEPELRRSGQAAPPQSKPISPAETPTAGSTIKILFLAANPRDTNSLRLDEEVRAIDEVLSRSPFRDQFDLIQAWAVRVADLEEVLLDHQPHVVHFSGYGSESNEIILEDAGGSSREVSERALARLFGVLKDNIRCVVLNACYSKKQAQAIAEEIECVVGTPKAIGDTAAVNFASSFYRALAHGRDVQKAFDLGCLQIDMEDLVEEDTPKLIARLGDPKGIFLVR